MNLLKWFPTMERTLIILKPDAIERGLVGEIISRFEKSGLKLVATKMVWPDEAIASKHYPADREAFIKGMGNKTLESHQEAGEDESKIFGSEDPHAIGLQLQKWLVDFLTSGPVIAGVLEGKDAIVKVREIAGHTIPAKADPGTIRGDYSDDTAMKANAEKRSIKNLVHASGDAEEAAFEISLWFTEEELHSY
jgi:nucleoside-diphosphate kinase